MYQSLNVFQLNGELSDRDQVVKLSVNGATQTNPNTTFQKLCKGKI